MNKLKIVILGLFISFAGFITADDHNKYPPTFSMEGLQCNFAEGKDMDDAMKVIAKWKDYGDKNFSAPYNAWVLTATYASKSDFPYDFAFTGYTFSGTDMGKVNDDWVNGGGAEKIGSQWEAVTDCSQALFTVVQARQSKMNFEEGSDSLMSIQTCTFREGKTGNDLAANDTVWNSWLDGLGFNGGVYRWWPGPGSPTSFEGDFYLAMGFESHEAFGKYRDDRMNSARADEMPEGILSCDMPRLYSAKNVRLDNNPKSEE